MTKTKTYFDGAELVAVAITVRAHATRFGTVYTASNDYGEPRGGRVRGYRTPGAAIEAEERELAAMFAA
jgi:hypothetical protein